MSQGIGTGDMPYSFHSYRGGGENGEHYGQLEKVVCMGIAGITAVS